MIGLMDDERAMIATVRAFVDRDVRPAVAGLERADAYPAELIATMRELGLFGMKVPEAYGGAALSTSCYALVNEELARGWMSLAGAVGGHSVVAHLIDRFGSDAQRERYLPRMATGELRATMALTEPSGGSDLQAMLTYATRDGDDWVINGAKTWISNAAHSGLIGLLCKTDRDATPSHA